MMKKSRVLVAMSGGVDSSTTAWLLKEEGHEVAGVFMSRGEAGAIKETVPLTASGGQSPSLPAERAAPRRPEPAERARRVAEFLGIPFHVADFSEAFDLLIDYFCSEYLRGRTPNPCAVCNPEIKFRKLLDEADRLGMEFLATGHYARISVSSVGGHLRVPPASRGAEEGGIPMHRDPPTGKERIQLRRGLDTNKDQSYYLFALSQKQLARSMFPLGERTKGEVRELARRIALPSAEAEESQDICFVPDREYPRLVRERLGAKITPGDIVDVEGRLVGRHEGIVDFTVGQRRGVRVAMGKPVYVVDIDPGRNRVVVGPADRLLVGEFAAENVNWVSIPPPREPMRAGVQIRYHSKPHPAVVSVAGRYSVHVKFDEPQRAVTPGQCAVFYDDDVLLGGGWISSGEHQ